MSVRYKIKDLRPTQIAVGMKEVDARIEKIREFKDEKLDEYVHGHKVPVVLGPGGRAYLVDHHHLVRACWEIGLKEIPVELVSDLSKLAYPAFWSALDKSGWLHTYDQFGGGPLDPVHLPESIRSLADDPYRSLAWAVRERGGFLKTGGAFVEFQWASYFRAKLDIHPVHDDFERASASALALAKKPEAASLPGFIPPAKP